MFSPYICPLWSSPWWWLQFLFPSWSERLLPLWPHRLVSPVLFQGSGPSHPLPGPSFLSGVGGLRLSCVVTLRSFHVCSVFRGGSGLHVVLPYPSMSHVARLCSLAEVFLSSDSLPASSWLSLLGPLSSLSGLVSGGHLRVRLLLLCLRRFWVSLMAPSSSVSVRGCA